MCDERNIYLLQSVLLSYLLRDVNLTSHPLGRGLIQQGVDLKNSPYYHNPLQPYIAYWGAGWTLFFIFINGYRVFWKFDAKDFLIACVYFHYNLDISSTDLMWLVYQDINIPIFLALYFGFKFVKNTSIWGPDEMDFVTVCVAFIQLDVTLLMINREYPLWMRRRNRKCNRRMSGAASLQSFSDGRILITYASMHWRVSNFQDTRGRRL